MIIQHNMTAWNANRQSKVNTGRAKKLSEKLFSGYKINRAADDAAGLSISEKMRKQIRGLNQAANNIQEGIGYVQVADGALEEVQDLKIELTRIFETTEFNDEKYGLIIQRFW